ncbi:MAG: DUF6049 family protein, partial [Nocardioides sp.]
MLRPVSLLPALVAVATLLVGLTAPVQAQAAPRADDAATPLAVTIEGLSPAAIPRKGPVRVSGTVTNRDDQTWRTINLYAFVSPVPMTSSIELAAAAEVDEEDFVGARILDPGTYDTVDELEPGASEAFSLTVPRSSIDVDASGVYWFGVHALGFDDAGGDEFADGRARTFIPLVPDTSRPVDTSLVIPVRHPVTHRPDGSLGQLVRWRRAFEDDGTLGSLADLGASAGTRPVSWLVDPAVIDAAVRLAAGNPPRYLGSTIDEDEGDDDQGEGSTSASPSPQPVPSEEAEDGDGDPEALQPRTLAAAEAAASWLDRLEGGLQGGEILALPYGDLDVSAAAVHAPSAYREARKRSAGDLAPWGLSTTPAVASPSGYLDAAGIRQTEPEATILVSDRVFGDPTPGGRIPSVVTTEGHSLVVTSSGAASGGPGPDDRLSAIAVRQRIVSEAAVRSLAPGRPPLVVTLPSTWTPDPDADFFAGFDDLEWLNLASVADATARTAREVPVERLDYPEEQAALELDASSFAAADDLVRAGETLQNLLTRNDLVASEVRDEALSDVSYADRADPARGMTSAGSSRSWIDTRLRSVRIDAPPAVILSSGSGRFATVVTNALDHPVSVRIRAVAEAPLEVSVPTDTIELAPDSRTTVLLDASSAAVGIRNLTLELTD